MSRTTWTLIGGPLLAVVLLAIVLGASPGVGLAMPPAGAAGLDRASGAAAPSVGQVPDARTYRPPVDAPVIDPFRPPAQPWLPGNRGLEYATPPGTLVRAIGPGVVSFAGPVAGSLHVTVTHPDGLRSSYSFLAAVRTVAGATVAAGDVVGVAAAQLHLGVRRGDRYLDPASLWGRRVGGGRVVLVPLDGGGSGAGPWGDPDGLPRRRPRSPSGDQALRAVVGVGATLAEVGADVGRALAAGWGREPGQRTVPVAEPGEFRPLVAVDRGPERNQADRRPRPLALLWPWGPEPGVATVDSRLATRWAALPTSAGFLPRSSCSAAASTHGARLRSTVGEESVPCRSPS